MDLTGFAIQVVVFAGLVLAINYYVLLRKKPNRWKLSLITTAITMLIYTIIVYFLKQV